MTTGSRTHAEDTAILLQDASRGGAPILIPGAREVHRGRSTENPPRAATPIPAIFHVPADIAMTPGRLVYQLEGGGAPSQRRGQSNGTRSTRFRRWVSRLFTGEVS